MHFIGIDPGLSGAIASIDFAGRFYGVRDLPTTEIPGDGTVTRRLHGAQLVRTINEILPAGESALCYLEDVQVWGTHGAASIGASSIAAMLGTKMVLWAVLDLFESRVEVRLVPPAVWKRHFGLKKPKDPTLSKPRLAAAFKAMSRARAVGQYPGAPIRQVGDDGRAEALLLARYARDVWATEGGIFDRCEPDRAPAPRPPTAHEIIEARAIADGIPLG